MVITPHMSEEIRRVDRRREPTEMENVPQIPLWTVDIHRDS
jgi:hypothetical protein